MKKEILIAAAVIFSSRLQAQQDTAHKTLDEVVVTATKSDVKQSQTGKVVSVIDQAMLQRNAGKTLTEILNYQAGVFLSLIHISEPTRRTPISYAVFCLKKKKKT